MGKVDRDKGYWIEYVRLDEIERWPHNPKRHNKDRIRRSILRFGFVDPMVWDERTKRLEEGHGRLEVLSMLQETGRPVPVGLRVDGDGMWQAPVMRGWASEDDAEAEAYAIAANRSGEAGWEEGKLAILLPALEPGLQRAAGFTEGQIEKIVAEQEGTVPQVEFSAELLIEHNYIVLYFDNPMDWEVARRVFGLKRVRDLIPRKAQSVGIGRVINGAEILARLDGDES